MQSIVASVGTVGYSHPFGGFGGGEEWGFVAQCKSRAWAPRPLQPFFLGGVTLSLRREDGAGGSGDGAGRGRRRDFGLRLRNAGHRRCQQPRAGEATGADLPARLLSRLAFPEAGFAASAVLPAKRPAPIGERRG